MVNLQSIALQIAREGLLAWHVAKPEEIANMRLRVSDSSTNSKAHEAFTVFVDENHDGGYKAEIRIVVDKEAIGNLHGANACLAVASERCYEKAREIRYPLNWYRGFYRAESRENVVNPTAPDDTRKGAPLSEEFKNHIRALWAQNNTAMIAEATYWHMLSLEPIKPDPNFRENNQVFAAIAIGILAGKMANKTPEDYFREVEPYFLTPFDWITHTK